MPLTSPSGDIVEEEEVENEKFQTPNGDPPQSSPQGLRTIVTEPSLPWRPSSVSYTWKFFYLKKITVTVKQCIQRFSLNYYFR